MFRRVYIYFLIAIIFGGVYLVYKNQFVEPLLLNNQSVVSDELNDVQSAPGEGVILKAPNPVSIPALAEKEYDGRDLTMGQILADNSYYTRYYITYMSGDLRISGIMNVPKGEGFFPVLILNHGYIDPGVYTNGRGLKREQDYLARQGYVVIHPDYRNHADSDKVDDSYMSLRLGYTEDVINAVYAVRDSDYDFFDKNNIGMLGHSMGGGITLNIITAKPDLIKAAVLFAPVSGDYRDNFDKWTRNRSERAEEIIAAYGEPDTNPKFWNEVSPLHFIDEVDVPVMIHHGDRDESVPLAWSEKLDQALQAAGKEVTFYIYPGEAHEFTKAWPLVMERTNEFFGQYLK